MGLIYLRLLGEDFLFGKYQTPRNDCDFGDEYRFENTPLVRNTLAKMKKTFQKPCRFTQAGMYNRYVLMEL